MIDTYGDFLCCCHPTIFYCYPRDSMEKRGLCPSGMGFSRSPQKAHICHRTNGLASCIRFANYLCNRQGKRPFVGPYSHLLISLWSIIPMFLSCKERVKSHDLEHDSPLSNGLQRKIPFATPSPPLWKQGTLEEKNI